MRWPMTSTDRARVWPALSIAAAVLAILGSAIALTSARVYRDLAPAFRVQAIAQDIVNLFLVSPATILLAVLTLRGSPRARLLWLGAVTFTVYNYVIYTVAVPFGPLFLLWVAVLGLSLYALIGGLATTEHAGCSSRRATVVAAWYLFVTAGLFGAIWLADDVPNLLAGTRPRSLAEVGLITNPVHILDLGFFLPAAVVTGSQLLRRRAFGHTAAPALIAFIALTGLPILVTPLVKSARGLPGGPGPVVPIAAITAISFALLVWLLARFRARE